MNKKIIKVLSLSLFAVSVFFIILYAGSLSPTVTTETPTMVTLSDINNLILNNVTTATSSDHSVSTTSSPTTTYVSVSELYANLANLIQQENIKSGVTYLGITGNYGTPDPSRYTFSTSSTSLTSSASPEATGYTLEDIYNLINSNSTTTVASHSFTNSSSVSSSMYSLSTLYSTLLSLIDPANVKSGITYLGQTGTYTPGVPGYALSLDGSSYVDVGNIDLQSELAISLWIKTTDSSGGMIFAKSGTQLGEVQYEIALDWSLTGKIVSRVRSTENNVQSQSVVNDDSWHHIVLTSSANTFYLYVDGVLQGSASTQSDSWNGNTLIGIRGNDTSLYYEGLIDDIAVWNRTLNQNEVTALYNSGSGLYGNLSNSPFDSGFIAGYNLDEGSGSTISDFSGNTYTGTIYSASGGGSCGDIWDPWACDMTPSCYYIPDEFACFDEFWNPQEYYDEWSCSSNGFMWVPTVPGYCDGTLDPMASEGTFAEGIVLMPPLGAVTCTIYSPSTGFHPCDATTRSGGAWTAFVPDFNNSVSLTIASNFRGQWSATNLGGDWAGGSGTSDSDVIVDTAPGTGHYVQWNYIAP